MLAMAIAVGLIPFGPSLWALYLCQYVNGLGAGAWDNGNNVWLVEMWPTKSSSALQFSQFMYGLGCVLAPIIVKPYLTGENGTHHQSTITSSLDRRDLLKTPFLIAGGLQAFSNYTNSATIFVLSSVFCSISSDRILNNVFHQTIQKTKHKTKAQRLD